MAAALRTWQQNAALRALGAARPSPDSLTLEETAIILRPDASKPRSKKKSSLGKRARKTLARRTARRDNRDKVIRGEHAENAMIYGVINEEMNDPTARRLFGDDNPWYRKMNIENTLIKNIEDGNFWMHSLKHNPDLTADEAQRLQDYYLTKLYNITREEEAPIARGSRYNSRRRKRRRRKTRHRRRRIKKRKRKRTKRRRH